MRKRSSILLYFDNYHLVSSLPDDQFALLFRALFDFSELEINGGGADLLSFPDRYPGMGEKTIGFFYFMADTVRRDAMAYNEKCANYRAAAQRRRDEQQSPPPPDNPPPAPRTAPPAPPALRSSPPPIQARSAPPPPAQPRRGRPAMTVPSSEDLAPYVRDLLAKKQRQPQEAASAEVHDSV